MGEIRFVKYVFLCKNTLLLLSYIHSLKEFHYSFFSQ